MQAYNLKRSPSTPAAALLGSACLTSSMTHAGGGGPENATLPDFDFNMPCRFFKSSFARSLSLNNNNNNNCNSTKSLDYDCNNYRNNNNCVAKTTTTNCLPLPKRAAVAASQNEVSSTTTTNEVDNHIVNNNNDVNDYDVDNVVVAFGSNEVEVAKSPPALPARRLLPPNGNYEQQQQQHKQMTQFRTSSSSTTTTSALINKVINQQQQQMSPPSNNNNNNGAINGNNNHRSYHHQQQQHHHHNHHSQQQQQQQQQHGCQMWPRDVINCQQQQDADSNAEPHPATAAAFELHENTLNVEAVILQNQVDTLQWQLKQVETSCEMYRAVMEEVARFLERYTSHTQQQRQQQQQQQQQNRNEQQIARSKSLYHVHGVGGGGGGAHDATSMLVSADEASNSYLRARSSTNLIGGGGKSMLTLSEEHNYEPIAPAGTYNAFKDFTWRRTPKKANGSTNAHTNDAGEEKLNQEAFRLSRTIHNLLSTQQPDLTQRNMLATHTPGRLAKAASTSVMTLHGGGAPPLHNSTILMECTPLPLATPTNVNVMMPKTPTLASNGTPLAVATAAAVATTPDMLFLRANNMRDSRLSLRSSTDSSVHSTISSTTTSSSASSSTSSMKLETDEEALTHAASSAYVGSTLKPHNAGSSTEDESGFSSISSFQDVGIPLSSTRICSTPRGSLKELATLTANNQSDSRNSTLKAPTPTAAALTHPNNVIGLPLHGVGAAAAAAVASPSKTYRNAAKYQRFSTLSNEDSATVLWV